MAEVIALAGWPPEVLAYAYAMYSRSALSIRESIRKITDEKATKFLETFYFQYGHASIADNAHIPLSLENISQIAAFEVEDEQLWDGQERSTRYQAFKRGGGYYIPESVKGTPFEAEYTEVAEFLLGEYEFFSKECFEILAKLNPKPAEMKDDAYERALRARAFDIARYCLFGGILTSVGQITNARTLERQISRLMSSEYPELWDIAEAMKQACTDKPFSPEGKDEPPVAPTLVKYTKPNEYLIALRALARNYILDLNLHSANWRIRVQLVSPTNPITEIIASFLYESSQRSYSDIVKRIEVLPADKRKEILGKIGELRGVHDSFDRAYKSGYAVQYDVVMDRGGVRDLHRHRRCVQVIQGLTTMHGIDTPKFIKENGLEQRYMNSMSQAGENVRKLQKNIGVDANYLIPFAFRSGVLYKMDIAEAAYIIELRSKPGGHFSYREAVCGMHDQLVDRYPELKGAIRVTPFSEENLLKR